MQKFNIYPWQKNLWEQLQERIYANAFPHAVLLTGTEGVGKLNVGMLLAQFLQCEKREADLPCGVCGSCHFFEKSESSDFRLLGDEKTPLKMEVLREVLAWVLLPPTRTAKVVLIVNAHDINHNAAAALLKTLEEPFSNIYFILITPYPEKLLPTLRSRVVKFFCQTPSSVESLSFAEKNLPALDKSSYELALQLAEGAPLLAKRIYDTDLAAYKATFDYCEKLLLGNHFLPEKKLFENSNAFFFSACMKWVRLSIREKKETIRLMQAQWFQIYTLCEYYYHRAEKQPTLNVRLQMADFVLEFRKITLPFLTDIHINLA